MSITPSWEKTFARHRRDMEDVASGRKPHLRFNKKLGLAYVTILETFSHYKGAKARNRENFRLEEWQKKAVAIWGGWEKLNSSGKWIRRFGESFWFMPKKNGKTILGSGLAIADSILRGEQGGEVYCFATKEKQARLAWEGIDEMLKNHYELKRYYKKAYHEIMMTKNNTTFNALGRDSKTIDGISATFGLADERHAHPDNSVYSNVQSSMAAREQPHMMAITTAGFMIATPCYFDYLHAKKVVDGTIEDDELFVFIAEAPEKPDNDDEFYFREETWKAANPNYGVSVDRDFLIKEAKKAKERPEFLNDFLVKHLNVWTTSAGAYLPLEKWNALRSDATIDGEFIGGFDLSVTDDFSAYVKVQKKDDEYHIVPKFYVPESTIQKRERELRVPLFSWVKSGHVTATRGDSVDYDYIEHDILKRIADQKVLCYDPYKAKYLIKKLEDEDGYTENIPITQGFRSLSEPTTLLLKLIKDGKIVHDGNPVLTWMISNFVVVSNPQGNVMPDKSEPNRKIDGVAAIINALAYLIHSNEEKKVNPYEKHGIRTL